MTHRSRQHGLKRRRQEGEEGSAHSSPELVQKKRIHHLIKFYSARSLDVETFSVLIFFNGAC